MHPVKEDALRYEGGQRGCSGVKRISNLHHFDLLGRYIGCLPNNEYQDDDEQTAEVFLTSKLSQVVYRCCLCSPHMMQSGLNLCHNADNDPHLIVMVMMLETFFQLGQSMIPLLSQSAQ